MPLQFPTDAEKALKEFTEAKKTVSLSAIAKRRGAFAYKQGDTIVWDFPDDTTLHVRGRGRNHKVSAELP
jgi:hypothetical protein